MNLGIGYAIAIGLVFSNKRHRTGWTTELTTWDRWEASI